MAAKMFPAKANDLFSDAEQVGSVADTGNRPDKLAGATDAQVDGGAKADFGMVDGSGGGDADGNGSSHDFGIMTPDEITASVGSMDSASKMNIIQALLATLTPEERQQIDTVPTDGLDTAGAAPVNPDEQYQMSITRTTKLISKQPGMAKVADREAKDWAKRIEILEENGLLSDKQAAAYKEEFNRERFSTLLDGRGKLNKACIEIETLEGVVAGMATLAKPKLGGRFSTARPQKPPVIDDNAATEAEQTGLGKRLGAMSV